jgi:ADP-ribosylglycohydrolase
MKNKIKGMFYGGAIGDALGMPVETWDRKRISETFGRVTKYHEPVGHKYLNGHPKALWTDDTQLSLAVANGILLAPLRMQPQAVTHVAAFLETTAGWGGTTREAIRNLANGVDYEQSGKNLGEKTGTGNGVAMKVAPIAVLMAFHRDSKIMLKEVYKFIIDLNLMTHRTSISASAALAHVFANYYCLTHTPKTFNEVEFIDGLVAASELGKGLEPQTLTDDITERFKDLYNHKEWDTDKIIKEYGGGSCYCYHSVPLAYMFFIKNPYSIDTLYDCISAGGDTDSTGSMVGNLLGALHGLKFFPKELLEGLQKKEVIEPVVNDLCEKFGFK